MQARRGRSSSRQSDVEWERRISATSPARASSRAKDARSSSVPALSSRIPLDWGTHSAFVPSGYLQSAATRSLSASVLNDAARRPIAGQLSVHPERNRSPSRQSDVSWDPRVSDKLPARASSHAKHARSSSVPALPSTSPILRPSSSNGRSISAQSSPSLRQRPTSAPVLPTRPTSAHGAAQVLDPKVWQTSAPALPAAPIAKPSAILPGGSSSAETLLRDAVFSVRQYIQDASTGLYFRPIAGQKAQIKLATSGPPDVEVYETHETNAVLAVYAAFKDCSVLWYRLVWPTSTEGTLHLDMRASYLPAPSLATLRIFAAKEGRAIASLARRWSAARKPVADHQGHDRGVCKAMVKYCFERFGFKWTQWGAPIYKRRANEDGGRVQRGLDGIEPGDIIYLKNVKAQAISFSGNGKVESQYDYKVSGTHGHVAIVVGAGSVATGPARAGYALRRPQERIDASEVSLVHGPFSARPRYLQLVEQSPGNLPATTIVDLATVELLHASNGELTIYRPVIRPFGYSYKHDRSEMADKQPSEANRAWRNWACPISTSGSESRPSSLSRASSARRSSFSPSHSALTSAPASMPTRNSRRSANLPSPRRRSYSAQRLSYEPRHRAVRRTGIVGLLEDALKRLVLF